MRKLIIGSLVIVMIAFVAAYLGFTRRWCPLVRSGSVYLNGAELEESVSFACGENAYLSFLIDNGEDLGAFLVDRERMTVSYLTETRYVRFDTGLFTLNQPPTSMIIGSIPAKTDTDPQASFSDDSVTFQIQEGKIVSVKLR